MKTIKDRTIVIMTVKDYFEKTVVYNAGMRNLSLLGFDGSEPVFMGTAKQMEKFKKEIK